MDQSSTPLQPVNPVPQSADAAALTAHARIERLSEPSAINCAVAIVVTLFLSVILGQWAATGEIGNIILLLVWFAAAMIIIFVQDYWWSPLLVITASAFGTTVLGFGMSGMEIGVVILTLTLPVKIAMKTLRKAEPVLRFPMSYLALLAFVCIDCVVILFYSKIEGAELKNIVKSYYSAITPLIYVGLLIRYCHLRTVGPVIRILFFTTFFVVAASIFTMLMGIEIDPSAQLGITVGWLNVQSAMGILRINGPLLFVACLASWPTARSMSGQWTIGLGTATGLIGTFFSGGRISLAQCIVAGIFFAVARRKAWLALPFLVVAAGIAGVVSLKPDLVSQLPESAQRALAVLNFSDQQTEIQQTLEGSDDWHKTLRDRSFTYWLTDTNSFWLGHGYKPWDADMTDINQLTPAEQDYLADLAVEMGLTENMFSAITNIFGMAGLVLYGWFMVYLAMTLFKVSRIAPAGSDARALSEFSLVYLLSAILFALHGGGVPGLNLVYWSLGFVTARQYLGIEQSVQAPLTPERPAFARPAYAATSPRGPNSAIIRPRHLGGGRG